MPLGPLTEQLFRSLRYFGTYLPISDNKRNITDTYESARVITRAKCPSSLTI